MSALSAAILSMQAQVRESGLRHEAIRLLREGLTVVDVFAALALDPNVVRSWIGDYRGGPT